MITSKKDALWEQDEQHWSTLMKQSQAGDTSAYNQLLSELGSVVENYLRANFGQLTVLEDCVQESLMAIHRARHTYDAKRAFRPWLFTIVHHKTIDVLRRSETVNRNISSLAEFEQSDVDHVDLDRMIDGERLMDYLSQDQREAVTLTKYHGMTTQEVAQLLGIKESAVKARLRRGLKTVQKQWKEEWVQP